MRKHVVFSFFFSSSLEPVKPGLQQLKEICPDASDLEIQGALDASNGNVNDAVGRLLGYFLFFYFTLKKVPVIKYIQRIQVNSGEGGWDDVPIDNV